MHPVFRFCSRSNHRPAVGSQSEEDYGNYELAFLVAAIMASFGVILPLFVQYQLKKRRKSILVQASTAMR